MAQQVVEMTSDEAKLFRGMQKIIDQQNKMQRGFTKTGRNAKKAGGEATRAAKATPGQQAIGMLGRYAAGWLSVSAVIGTVNRALQEHRQLREQAVADKQALFGSEQKLGQVFEGAELRRAAALRDRIIREDATPNFGAQQATDFLFAAQSFGISLEDAKRIAGRSEAVDPLAAITAAGKQKKLFQGQLTPLESANLTLAAAETSDLSFEQFTPAVATVAGTATAAGTDPVETLATLSSLAASFKSGEQAATRLAALSGKLAIEEDPRLKDKGLLDAVTALAKDPELRAEFQGENKEVFEAIEAIVANRDTIEATEARLREERKLVGTEESVLARRERSNLENIPGFAGAVATARADEARKLEEQNRFVQGEAEFQTQQSKEQARQAREGRDAFETLGSNTALSAAGGLGVSDTETVSAASFVGEAVGGNFLPVFGVFRSMARGIDAIQENTARTAQGNLNAAANAQAGGGAFGD